MTEPSSPSDAEPTKAPPGFRLRPSRNQKQRSKLRQSAEEAAVSTPDAAETPAPPNPPPPAPASPSAASKNVRFKRSGRLHEDLIAPIPDDPSEKEPEY